MVVAVDHDAFGFRGLEQVAGEKAHVLAFFELEADLALDAGRADLALLVEDGHVPARGRPADGAGLGCHAGEGRDLQARFGLAVAFVDGQTGDLLPGTKHAVVKELAGGGAVAQRREVVLGKVLADEEAVDGRRSAKGRDLVLAHDLEQLRRDELAAKIPDEDHGPGHPLAVELAPHGLAPAGVGHGQVHVAGLQVVPVDAGRHVAQGVAVGVLHHLGHAGGAGGEKDEQGVLAARGVADAGEGIRGGGADGFVVEPARGHGGLAHVDEDFERRAGGAGGLHARDHGILGDDALDAGVVDAEVDVVGGEQVGRRHGHGPELVQGEHGHPPLHAAVEDDHDAVAFFEPRVLEGIGQAGRFTAEAGEVEIPAGSVRADMDHGRPGRVRGGLGIEKVESEIIVFGHGDGHGLQQFAVGLWSQFGDWHGLGLPGKTVVFASIHSGTGRDGRPGVAPDGTRRPAR
ncbi:hypothetical protein DSECCO2_609650 [anaerobic digester metagenome]